MFPEKSLQENTTRYDNIPILLVASMMFLPLSTSGNLIRFGIAIVLFVLFFINERITSISKKMVFIFAFMVLSLFISRFSVLSIEGVGNSSIWTHELQRIGFYILLIIVVYNCKVSFDFIFKICILTLLFHVTIQTLQLMGVESVFEFIEKYYLEEGDSGVHLTLARSKNIANFRSGSIYMNPNVYMVLPLSILGVILQRDKIKPSIYNLLLVGVVLYSLLLTGSRTTLIIAICMLVYYFIKREDLQGLRWIILVVGAIILISTFSIMASNYRAFNISSGIAGSFDKKFELIGSYLVNSNPMYLITGSLSSLQTDGMDSEWTHIYAYFGVLGVAWYSCFLSLLLRNKDRFPLQSILLTLNVFLLAASASVLLCMPVFAFVCMVSLAEIE